MYNTPSERYQAYLHGLTKSFTKLTRLEFLNSDGSVAFSLGNGFKPNYNRFDTRAFIKEGTLNVNLQNGQRRTADITLSNVDDAFDFAVNKFWFGNQVRLSMGLILDDGSEFYLPQGVFYLDNPSGEIRPNGKTIKYNLVDKWSYLDGSLFGNLEGMYQVDVGTNIFTAMNSILKLSRYDFTATTDKSRMIDNVEPNFTAYYNGKSYQRSESDIGGSGTIPMTSVPYTIVTGTTDNFATVLTKLNEVIVGLIGYDCTGALSVEPSQDDVNDYEKPVLWTFSPENCNLCGFSENYNNQDVYNDILIVGQGLTGYDVWGRATNNDPRSNTNVKLLGKKLLREDNADYWNAQQCQDLAEWKLKRKTVLHKSISIESSQMFHLQENKLIAVKRTDKEGSPVEKHIIQSFSIPLSDVGSMTINATSVNDIPQFTVTKGRS